MGGFFSREGVVQGGSVPSGTCIPLLLCLPYLSGILMMTGTLSICASCAPASRSISSCAGFASGSSNVYIGWFEGERLFVAEMLLPPLSEEMGAVLLQHLGLTAVPAEHLRKVSAAVGGIPLCLEWVASLVQEPLLVASAQRVQLLPMVAALLRARFSV